MLQPAVRQGSGYPGSVSSPGQTVLARADESWGSSLNQDHQVVPLGCGSSISVGCLRGRVFTQAVVHMHLLRSPDYCRSQIVAHMAVHLVLEGQICCMQLNAAAVMSGVSLGKIQLSSSPQAKSPDFRTTTICCWQYRYCLGKVVASDCQTSRRGFSSSRYNASAFQYYAYIWRSAAGQIWQQQQLQKFASIPCGSSELRGYGLSQAIASWLHEACQICWLAHLILMTRHTLRKVIT